MSALSAESVAELNEVLPGASVAEPLCTRNFDGALAEIEQGCQGLVEQLTRMWE